MSERPSSPLDTVLNNSANIEHIIKKQNEMEQMMSNVVSMISKLEMSQKQQTQTVTNELASHLHKDAKMPDVKEFGGDTQEYHQFEILLDAFFRNQPTRFYQDYSKIDYVGSRLTGKALEWFTNFKLGERKKETAASYSYTVFWEKFSKQFKAKYGAMVAEHQIHQLRQGKSNIKDYISKFENVLALTTEVTDVKGVFLRSVPNPITK
jgi:hypothetical protein